MLHRFVEKKKIREILLFCIHTREKIASLHAWHGQHYPYWKGAARLTLGLLRAQKFVHCGLSGGIPDLHSKDRGGEDRFKFCICGDPGTSAPSASMVIPLGCCFDVGVRLSQLRIMFLTLAVVV